jgi:hypothetical protein
MPLANSVAASTGRVQGDKAGAAGRRAGDASEQYGERVVVERRITCCRDWKGAKFLEAAVAGQADVIVSGDDGRLVLSPFEGIPIVGPSTRGPGRDSSSPKGLAA